MDTKVRGRKDIEANLSVPFLGDIPYSPSSAKANQSHTALVEHNNGRGTLSEAFRILRTNLEFMRVKSPDMKVIMLTSYQMAGSGKTFTCINLALSMAAAKKRVIIVDLDLRKGMLSARLGSDADRPGMSAYLAGTFSGMLDELVLHKDFDGLRIDYMQAGPFPPNPSELLMSERMEHLFNALRKHYDYIIVDGVPYGLVADADIMNRVADMTICMIRAGKLDRRQLPEIERLYKNERLKNMAVVLNAVNYKYAGYYSYYYGYGYNNYGYSYGYGNDNEKGNS
jgi:capsular exopolysaccharide synthesis family protein